MPTPPGAGEDLDMAQGIREKKPLEDLKPRIKKPSE